MLPSFTFCDRAWSWYRLCRCRCLFHRRRKGTLTRTFGDTWATIQPFCACFQDLSCPLWRLMWRRL